MPINNGPVNGSFFFPSVLATRSGRGPVLRRFRRLGLARSKDFNVRHCAETALSTLPTKISPGLLLAPTFSTLLNTSRSIIRHYNICLFADSGKNVRTEQSNCNISPYFATPGTREDTCWCHPTVPTPWAS